MADELISRQAVMEVVYENQGDDLYPPDMVAMRRGLMQLPAVDAVEVVRCKDCKWCVDKDERTGCGHCDCINRDVFANDVEAFEAVSLDDFCSYGERREENAAG